MQPCLSAADNNPSPIITRVDISDVGPPDYRITISTFYHTSLPHESSNLMEYQLYGSSSFMVVQNASIVSHQSDLYLPHIYIQRDAQRTHNDEVNSIVH